MSKELKVSESDTLDGMVEMTEKQTKVDQTREEMQAKNVSYVHQR